MIKKRFICIGASAAGIACINKLRMLDPEREIICFSAESETPYNKCLLADWLSDKKTQSQVTLASQEQLRQKGVVLYPNTPIVRIDTVQKSVISASGESYSYDDLLIATGARPFVPPIQGLSGLGVFTFHTALDTKNISDFITNYKPKRALVIGAGLTGLEAADALWQRGVPYVTILEKTERIMSELIPQSASDFLGDHLKSLAIEFVCNQQITSVSRDIDHILVTYASGQQVTTDMIIVATGVRSNSEIALQAGITCQQGAVVVDPCMQTSVPHIYAAGDVALVKDQITQGLIASRTWPDAMAQGMTAAHALAGVPRPYSGVVMSLNSAFFGLKFASSYAISGLALDAESSQVTHSPEPSYAFIKTIQGVVTGYCLIGNTSEAPGLRRSLVTKQPL